MLGRKRSISTEEIVRAWKTSRDARIAMRMLVGEEQQEAAAAYARIVEPLRVAFEETGNPGFALLALRVLRPTSTSVRRSGDALQYAHAPRWCIDALLRAVQGVCADRVGEARRRWHATEVATRDQLFKEVGALSDREAQRLLDEWFGANE